MDKETLSHYGWIVVLCIILSLLLAFCSPFGNFIADAIKSTTVGFTQTSENGIGTVLIGKSGDTKFDNGLFYRDGELANEELDSGWKFKDGRLYKDDEPYTGFFEDNYYKDGYKDNYDYELYYDITLKEYFYRVTGETGDGYRRPTGSSSGGAGGTTGTGSIVNRNIGDTISIPPTSGGTLTNSDGQKYRVPSWWTMKDVAINKLYGGDASKMQLDDDGIRWKTEDGYTHYFVGGNKVELENALSLSTSVDNQRTYTHVIIEKTVDLEYNPSLRLYVSSTNIVVYVEYLNKDAIKVYSDSELVGKTLKEALSIIVKSGKESGKLNNKTSDIKVVVAGKDALNSESSIKSMLKSYLADNGLKNVDVSTDSTSSISTQPPATGGSSTAPSVKPSVSNQTESPVDKSKLATFYMNGNPTIQTTSIGSTAQSVFSTKSTVKIVNKSPLTLIVIDKYRYSYATSEVSARFTKVTVQKDGKNISASDKIQKGNYTLVPTNSSYTTFYLTSKFDPQIINTQFNFSLTTKEALEYSYNVYRNVLHHSLGVTIGNSYVTYNNINYQIQNASGNNVGMSANISSNVRYMLGLENSGPGLYDSNGRKLATWSGISFQAWDSRDKALASSTHLSNVIKNRYPTTTKIILPAGTVVPSFSIDSCNTLKEIIIPEGYESLGQNSIQCCDALEYISFPSTLCSYYSICLTDCPKLKSLDFSKCNISKFTSTILASNFGSLKTLVYPEKATEIGGIFTKTTGKLPIITSIYIPQNVAIISDRTLYCMPELTTVSISSSNKNFVVRNNVIYTSDMQTICCVPENYQSEDITIPSTVKNIGEYSFKDNKNITSIYYDGTLEQWNSIKFGSEKWYYGMKEFTVYCTDGTKVYAAQKNDDGGGCIPEGTLITLADGTQKPIEQVTPEDKLLVFNHDTGKYDVAKVNFIEDNGKDYYDVFNLKFSDGTTTRAIYEHGYFDIDLMKYVYINKNTYKDYIGHRFYKDNNGTRQEVTLLDCYITNEYTHSYGITSEYHLDLFTDNILSIEGCMTGAFNIFKYDNNLQYNQEEMKHDIETYGLLPYEMFKDLMTEETFNKYPAKYLKISIAKGFMTEEMLNTLVQKYVIPNA